MWGRSAGARGTRRRSVGQRGGLHDEELLDLHVLHGVPAGPAPRRRNLYRRSQGTQGQLSQAKLARGTVRAVGVKPCV